MATPQILASISLCFCAISSAAAPITDKIPDLSGNRFVTLDERGMPLAPQGGVGFCVLDRKTALVWEIKTNEGLHHRDHTYSWFDPHQKTNGGAAGTPNGGHCAGSACDTAAYVQAVNRAGLCGAKNWRLPSREELRSLVDYTRHTPSIDSDYFPNTKAQFYWSANPDASSKDSAWGIGFTFGYDYSYFKSDLGYVRLVTQGTR